MTPKIHSLKLSSPAKAVSSPSRKVTKIVHYIPFPYDTRPSKSEQVTNVTELSRQFGEITFPDQRIQNLQEEVRHRVSRKDEHHTQKQGYQTKSDCVDGTNCRSQITRIIQKEPARSPDLSHYSESEYRT